MLGKDAQCHIPDIDDRAKETVCYDVWHTQFCTHNWTARQIANLVAVIWIKNSTVNPRSLQCTSNTLSRGWEALNTDPDETSCKDAHDVSCTAAHENNCKDERLNSISPIKKNWTLPLLCSSWNNSRKMKLNGPWRYVKYQMLLQHVSIHVALYIHYLSNSPVLTNCPVLMQLQNNLKIREQAFMLHVAICFPSPLVWERQDTNTNK